MLILQEYLDEDGASPFAEWFSNLDALAAAKITVVLARIEQGNLSNVKGVGEGVLEYKLDFGSGYRVCFGRDGDALVLLLGGAEPRSGNNNGTSKPHKPVGQRTSNGND
ncbi:MAG: type II toxin-antitoxin system RelE/ParE family toxin [Burkholderiales bacterium]|jgi:putative addiction module killer protein|nr:type II toxin-antitoxin system RelE/ParE family toxin [Burkholderiales bacterium]